MKATSDKHEARVTEVQRELKDVITKCEDLEQKNKDHATELANTDGDPRGAVGDTVHPRGASTSKENCKW